LNAEIIGAINDYVERRKGEIRAEIDELKRLKDPGERRKMGIERDDQNPVAEINKTIAALETENRELDTTTIDQYLEKASHNGFWGSGAEIYAISKMFKVPVLILNKNDNKLNLSPPDSAVKPLKIVNSGNHYDVKVN
jgi:hypothetical protein